MSPGHALELLLDPVGEARVRGDWWRLEEAGVPSLARHRGSTHRPHVTVVVGGAPGKVVLDLARELLVPLLPLCATVRGQVLLGGRRPALAHLLQVSDDLRVAQQQLVGRWSTADARPWVPHVSLTRRTRPSQLFVALAALAPTRPTRAGADRRSTDPAGVGPSRPAVPATYRLVAVRWWDPDAGTVTDLDGTAAGPSARP